jgi:hypothetical protein
MSIAGSPFGTAPICLGVQNGTQDAGTGRVKNFELVTAAVTTPKITNEPWSSMQRVKESKQDHSQE